MPGLPPIFRHCPSCGRRFEIRLVGKEEVAATESVATTRKERPFIYYAGRNKYSVRVHLDSTRGPVTADVPTLDEDDIVRYEYRCVHCGHEWTEDKAKHFEGRVAEDDTQGTDPWAFSGGLAPSAGPASFERAPPPRGLKPAALATDS